MDTWRDYVEDDIRELSRQILHSLSHGASELSWDALSTADLDQLLDVVASPDGQPAHLSASEIEKLKRLPLFENLCGERVPLTSAGDYFTLDSPETTDALPMPPSAGSRFLVAKPQYGDLYTDIGISRLSESGVVSRFLLPEFGAMTKAQQTSMLTWLRQQWETLSTDEALLAALKEVAFVPVGPGAVLTKPSALLDPSHELLKDIFGEDPQAFPEGEFASEPWLLILRELGLRSRIDKETFLECARKIEAQRAVPLAPAVGEQAARLLLCLQTGTGSDEFYSVGFTRSLASIACVPAERATQSDSDAAVGGARDVVLVQFSEAVVPADRHLAGTVMPVIAESLVPPQLMWSSLGIVTPPPLGVVLRHLRLLCSGDGPEQGCNQNGLLDRGWPFDETPAHVFAAIFRHLESHWSKVSPQVKEALKELPCVPIGGRLIKASRLFLRLGEDLAPFMFELPRAFQAPTLFKALGTRPSPTVGDYSAFLNELHADTRGFALNPNELAAVLKVIRLVTVALKSGTSGDAPSGTLVIPDDQSKLAPLGDCLFNDASWLRGRVETSNLRMTHPSLSLAMCRSLGVSKASEIVREVLEPGFAPEPCLTSDGSEHALTQTLRSPEFAMGVACIINHVAHADGAAGDDTGAQAAAATAGDFAMAASGGAGELDGEAVAREVERRLNNFRVQYVNSLRSRFLRRRASSGLVGTTEDDITAPHGVEGSIFFVDDRDAARVVLIAKPLLPPSVAPAVVLAMAIAQHLALGDSFVSPLSAIVGAPPGDIERVLALLRLQTDVARTTERRRGVPGEPLLPMDRAMLELKPTRQLLPNEIVAVDDGGTLRYGLHRWMADDDDDDSPEGTASADASAAIRQVRIQLNASRVTTLLSSEVYSFRAAQASNVPSAAASVSVSPSDARVVESGRAVAAASDEARADVSADVPLTAIDTASTRVSPVSSAQLLDAVEAMLQKVDLSLAGDQRSLMEEHLRQREKLRHAERTLEESRATAKALTEELQRELGPASPSDLAGGGHSGHGLSLLSQVHRTSSCVLLRAK